MTVYLETVVITVVPGRWGRDSSNVPFEPVTGTESHLDEFQRTAG